jgi:hypothetical protein
LAFVLHRKGRLVTVPFVDGHLPESGGEISGGEDFTYRSSDVGKDFTSRLSDVDVEMSAMVRASFSCWTQQVGTFF